MKKNIALLMVMFSFALHCEGPASASWGSMFWGVEEPETKSIKDPKRAVGVVVRGYSGSLSDSIKEEYEPEIKNIKDVGENTLSDLLQEFQSEEQQKKIKMSGYRAAGDAAIKQIDIKMEGMGKPNTTKTKIARFGLEEVKKTIENAPSLSKKKRQKYRERIEKSIKNLAQDLSDLNQFHSQETIVKRVGDTGAVIGRTAGKMNRIPGMKYPGTLAGRIAAEKATRNLIEKSESGKLDDYLEVIKRLKDSFSFEDSQELGSDIGKQAGSKAAELYWQGGYGEGIAKWTGEKVGGRFGREFATNNYDTIKSGLGGLVETLESKQRQLKNKPKRRMHAPKKSSSAAYQSFKTKFQQPTKRAKKAG